MSDIKKAFEALDRLKSVVRNPRGWGEYGQFTDSMELFKKDIRAIENVMAKPGTMRKKIRHAQAFYMNEYGESRIDIPFEEQQQTELLLIHIQHALAFFTSKTITSEKAIEMIREGMVAYYGEEKFETDSELRITVSDGIEVGTKYLVKFPEYPGVIGQDDDMYVALKEALEALEVLQDYLKEEKDGVTKET